MTQHHESPAPGEEAEAQANALLRAAQLRHAAPYFRVAMESVAGREPVDWDRFGALRHRLAWCLWRTGQVHAAISLYSDDRAPFDHHACRSLGDLYAEVDRPDEAARCYATVLNWVEARLRSRLLTMSVLAAHAAFAAGRGINPRVVDAFLTAAIGRGAIFKRVSLGLPMLWSCLADMHQRLGRTESEAALRKMFRRYWAGYAGPEHPSVLALSGGGEHARI